MADRILVNTDLLERCASDLKTAARGFSEAASILSGLNTGEEWWDKIKGFSSVSLQDEGSSVPMGTAGASVRALANAARRYDGRMTKLGQSVSDVASMFGSLESSLCSKANGQSAGVDPGVEAAAAAGAVTAGAAAGAKSATGGGAAKEKEGFDWQKHLRKIIGKGGVAGKSISTAWGLIYDIATGSLTAGGLTKYVADGVSIVSKWRDLNSRYGKLGNLGKEYAGKLKMKEMFGLNKFWNGRTSATRLSGAASGLDRFRADFSKQFKKGMTSKSAWIIAGVTSAVDNISEHWEGLKTGAVTVDRVGVEWATEMAGTVAMGAATTALAGAGLAAVGFAGAPVIVVGAAAYAISCGADWAFKKITGSEKGIAATVGDKVGEVYDKTIGPAIRSGVDKMKNWAASKVKAGWKKLFG